MCICRPKRVQVELPSDLNLKSAEKVHKFDKTLSDNTDTTGVLTPEKLDSWDTVENIVDTISDHFRMVLSFPSQSSIPTPVQLDEDDSTTTDEEQGTSSAPCVNMTGSYKLVHQIDYDEFLKGLNIPWAMRRAAAATRPTHVVTHTGNRFRLQIEGIIKSDSTYLIGGEGKETRIRHLKFWDTVTYLESGDGIQTRKVALDAGDIKSTAKEIIVTRQFNKGGGVLVMTSKAIFPDGSETKSAIQTFHKIK